jgi:hypothetical protein
MWMKQRLESIPWNQVKRYEERGGVTDGQQITTEVMINGD